MRHCVPSNVSSGLFNRPLRYVYIDGKPDMTKPTNRTLGTGEEIIGAQSYSSMLSFFTTTDITPDEVYSKGLEMVNHTYPKVRPIATEQTKRKGPVIIVQNVRANVYAKVKHSLKNPLKICWRKFAYYFVQCTRELI